MIELPDKCMRGLKTCEPLSQIVSDSGISFFCCGQNDGTMSHIKQDNFTVCFKGEHDDKISYNDKRDLTHNASVLIQALAIIEERNVDDKGD